MIIEKMDETAFAYLSQVGPYGVGNEQLMTELKKLLIKQNRLTEDGVILGIALDNPATTPPEQQRYEVGLLVESKMKIPGLAHRILPAGAYAIFEVAHTAEGVTEFWQNLANYTKDLTVDWEQPILERYEVAKLKQHRCEFCVPLTE